MKKLIIVPVIIFLSAFPAVFSQEVGIATFNTNGNTLRFDTTSKDLSLILNFEGKLNGKSIDFKMENPISVNMNDGKLSSGEVGLVESAINIMKSALNGDKSEVPGISFTIKYEGKSLRVEIKSGTGDFEGKLEGAINGKPLDFQSDVGGGIILNNGELSDPQNSRIISGLESIKYCFGMKTNLIISGGDPRNRFIRMDPKLVQ